MKTHLLIAVLLASFMALAQEKPAAKISLADARSKIDRVIASPKEMKETMQQLSAEDQKAFLADVNKAVNEMPGSKEEKAATFLALNMVAVTSAQKGNSSTLFAEAFATIPPEVLPVVAERFASELLSREANPAVQINDAQYEKIAVSVMEKVNERCEETDNGSARTGFAMASFMMASGGTSEALMNSLVNTLRNDDAKEMAKSEWLPSALGLDGREKSFDALLASADAGHRPDYAQVLVISGVQYGDVVRADLGGKNTEQDLNAQVLTPIMDAVENVFGQQAVRAGNDPGGAGEAGGAVHGAAIEAGEVGGGKDTRPNPTNPDPKDTGKSPVPYVGQTF